MAKKKRVVVIGAGFAGISVVKSLKNVDVEIVLIDRRNYHLFQPLLYQVATAALSPAQIAQPIRSILRDHTNCTVALGEVEAVDTTTRIVKGRNGQIQYDYLVIATGATHNYFGHDEWGPFAPGLKSIEDATMLRQRILSAFEYAEIPQDEERRQAFLTFVIVGGGATGVEMAGAIAELAKNTLKKDFRNIDVNKTRVLLVEAGKTILANFPASLSRRAKSDLQTLGVEVIEGSAVSECNAKGVTIAGKFVAAHTVIWAAGVKASPAAEWLGAEKDRAGRVIVNPDLTVPGHPNIFVIGDTASAKNKDGTPIPGLAPAAMQQGAYVARLIKNQLSGTSQQPAPFVYKNYGTMATIGRAKAIASLKNFSFGGFIAWCLWSAIHIVPLVGFRNRLMVASDWFWSYLTNERKVRLITVTQNTQSEI